MDVAIVRCRECFFSREAEAHVRGFFDKLMTADKQKMDVELKSYNLNDLDHATDRVVVHSAKVQIVIISHHFLQRLKDEASRRPRLSPINRVFRSKNVIAVLIAVTAKEVLDGYESVLPRFREWFSVDLRSTNKSDAEFCKKFTEQVVRIYNVELSNSSNFSVFPKKVTREQPKIAIVFKKPVEQSDEVRIELRTAKQVNVISDVKMENPHTTFLRIPESLSPDREAIVDVSVFINKNKIGGSRIKSELNLRRFDEDDVDRMAKLLPPYLEWLDKHIADTLLSHYKECTDYTADPELELMNGIIICKGDILPTIMHFAAYYGLTKTAFTVLEEADGLTQCNVKNDLEETPSDIAFARGHTKIGQLIGDYQEISNSYIAYRYIKELVEKDTDNLEELGRDDDASTEIVKGQENDLMNGGKEDENLSEERNDQSDDLGNTEDVNYKNTDLVTKTSTSEENLVECESSVKSEDEKVETKVPTPLTRRANRLIKGREYINVDGNPEHNPEIVETRVKTIVHVSPIIAKKKRQSIIQNYDIPRTRDQDYEVPPPDVRPVQSDDKIVTVPVFKPKNSGTHVTTSGYLIMDDGTEANTEVPKTNTADDATGGVNTDHCVIKDSGSQRKISVIQEYSTLPPSTPPASSRSEQERRPSFNLNRNNDNAAVALDPADEQLIYLLNDFKNKTYDMHMVELLFENWKQRPDVQKSIEDKMKMLDGLREEYRNLRQQNKGVKKPTALDRIKNILSMKRKKSNIQQPVSGDLYPVQRKASVSSTNGVMSPTNLTFTGPCLSPQPFNNAVPGSNTPPPLHFQPPYPYPSQGSRLDSESSYRTSIDSRYSDSSSDGEKQSNEAPANNKTAQTTQQLSTPPEYKNPMSKRFIPSYVCPNPLPSTTSEKQESGSSSSSVSSADSFDNNSYQVPPPPRPVKPNRKPIPTIPENPTASPNLSRKPPIIPAKPFPKYQEDDVCSPPPQPPPRNHNSSNLFSYIDYKKKNHESSGNKSTSPSPNPKSYENMESEAELKR